MQFVCREGVPRCGVGIVGSASHTEDDVGEYRFNPKGAGFLDTAVKSPDRNVRSRLYFTSESHIHAMLNLLRFGGWVHITTTLLTAIVCALVRFSTTAVHGHHLVEGWRNVT
jgi:hypothetical protein